MGAQVADSILVLFFLGCLVAISKYRGYLRGVDKTSYKHISSGLAILSIVFLAQLYNGLGVFAGVPFLSESLFYQLASWSAIITGTMLLISGVTVWLPLSRAHRQYSRERIERLGLIKQVARLVRIENRVPVILEKTLDQMMETCSLAKGAVYVYSRSTGRLVLIAGRGQKEESPEFPTQADIAREALRRYAREVDYSTLVREGLGIAHKPDKIVPLEVQDRLAGLFVLWQDADHPVSDEDRVNLRITGDIIAREIQLGELIHKDEYHEAQQHWQASLASRLDFRKDTRDNLSSLVAGLKEKMPLDYFSLTVVHHDGHAQRFTIGSNEGILMEVDVDFGGTTPEAHRVYQTGVKAVINDLRHASGAADSILLKTGMQSYAALPVTRGGRVEGVAVFAADRREAYGPRQLALLEQCLPMIFSLVKEQQHRYNLDVRDRRASLAVGLLKDAARGMDLRQTFQRVADIVAGELKSTCVRVSTYDARGKFMTSQALVTSRSMKNVTPTDGVMILSLMPYHRLARDTGRVMMINQTSTDRKLSDAERNQVFGTSLGSALIAPIVAGDNTPAVISVGEMRHWERCPFRQPEVDFVSYLASVLSVVIQLGIKGKAASRLRLENQRLIERVSSAPELGSRIRSSLTGIMGSVEMLKTSSSDQDDELEKYLSIIDKSAQRIGDYLEEPVS